MTSLGDVELGATCYLCIWETTESQLVFRLRSDGGDRIRALQRAATYFRVVRNFPRTFDVDAGSKRLQPALTILDEFRGVSLAGDALADTVDDLRDRLGEAYGGRDLLSAATKFLWLLRGDPVVIFDEQARHALSARREYSDFVERWERRYEQTRDSIAEACESLSSLFLAPMQAPLQEEQFRRRVLDNVLWREGK